LYGKLSMGFTPPEVSQLYGRTAIPELNPATYDNVELGWRALLASGIRLDTALYQLSGKDTIVSYTPEVGNSFNKNAGNTRSRGLELSLNQSLGAWDWQMGATWAEHTFVSYRVSDKVGAIEDYSGKDMPQAPNHTITAQVGWKFTPASRVALGLVKQGSYWMNNANTVRYAGHTLLNLTASHKLADGWEVWGQVRNLTDKSYSDNASSRYSAGTYTPNTQNTYAAGAPRSLMVGVNKMFGGR
jgi:outer membrane receptor protein involved in Fe transport